MPPAGGLARGVAGLAGIAVLVLGAVISLGVVPLGAIGAWLARRVLRRGVEPGPGIRWFASTAMVGLATLAAGAFMFASLPSGTMARAKTAVDSAQAAPPPPPPAWMDRVFPGASARAARQPRVPAKVAPALMVWGVAMAGTMMVLFYGTLGWLGGLLLSFARRGRWPAVPLPPVPRMADG